MNVNLLGLAIEADVIFLVLLIVSILIMLLTITAIHRKLRVLEHHIQALRKEQSVISEEMEVLAGSQRPGPASDS